MQADTTREPALGATGVPPPVIMRRHGVSGAHPSELFREALETADREGVVAGG